MVWQTTADGRSLPRSRFVVLLSACLAVGCQYGAYFFRDTRRPMEAVEVRMDPDVRRSCLLVFMPGMLNLPDAYVEHGFVADAVRASRRCDIVLADAHFGYYRDRTLARQVGQDILLVADERGYTDIWLVGSSLGGMGAVMVAREHPERIAGIVLFGPFFGDDALIRSIEDAGGLDGWDGGEGNGPSVFDPEPTALWSWLRGYATHPDRMPPLYVGVGADDGMRSGVDLLASHLPETHLGLAPGQLQVR